MVPTGIVATPTGPPRVYLDFVARDMGDADRDFICNSYLLSFRRERPMCWVPHTIYYGPQGKVLTYLLDKARVLVACFPEDPGEILGYIIYDYMGDVLVVHYAYAKLDGRGIKHRLLETVAGGLSMAVVTHSFPGMKSLLNRNSRTAVHYDPYLIQRLMANG